MQGLRTPNGWATVAKTNGAAEATIPIPDNTREIEVWAKTTDFKVGLSPDTTDMLGSTSNSVIAVAGATEPQRFRVNPAKDFVLSGPNTANPQQARSFNHVHYILGAAADGTIVINFFR